MAEPTPTVDDEWVIRDLLDSGLLMTWFDSTGHNKVEQKLQNRSLGNATLDIHN